MGRSRQQGKTTRDLFAALEGAAADLRHGDRGEGGTQAAAHEESQALMASNPNRAANPSLTGLQSHHEWTLVMEAVCQRDNLNQAYKHVKANRGGPGLDGMTVADLLPWLKAHGAQLVQSLLSGTYQPQPVKAVEIAKPDGGVRQLGIPTVIDRFVQQALLQVLQPKLDATFSPFSFGYRPKRSAQQALRLAQEFVSEGRLIVVDVDLEQFFDHVNHDLVLARLRRHVADPRVLKLVGRFLRAGLMRGGVCVSRHEGTPQGGPLSPLLANLLLHDWDLELERRGHKFVRYADDCNIYVRTKAAGERVLASVKRFLASRLRLRVNATKSAVAYVEERKFLGHRLLAGGKLGIAPKSVQRVKDKIRELTGRSRGVSIERMIGELNSYLRGWLTFFRSAAIKGLLRELDSWLRRKLRCVKLKHCKRAKPIADFLCKHGVPARSAWSVALSGKGWWRLSDSPPLHHAMDANWFKAHELIDLQQRYAELTNVA